MRPNDARDANSGGLRPSNPVTGADPGGEPMRNRMDDEHVAALHDGRLGERERDELHRQIMADDFELDVFGETAAVLREIEEAHGAALPVAAADPAPSHGDASPVEFAGRGESDSVIPLSTRRPPPSSVIDVDDGAPEDSGDGVIPIRSRRAPGRRWMMYGAIAAGLAGIGLATEMRRRSGSAFDDPVGAIAMLEGGAARGPAAGWDEEPWRPPPTRGFEDRKVAFEQLAVRSGVYLVDLELADAARDTAAVRSLAGEMEAQLDSVRGTGGIADVYRRAKNAGPDSARPLLAQGRENLRTFLRSEWLELGVWAETARTAAVRRDAAFFRKGRTRRVLERLATSPELDDETRKALGTVRGAISGSGNVNVAALQKHLTELLRIAGKKR
jgi:hypothetical protein